MEVNLDRRSGHSAIGRANRDFVEDKYKRNSGHVSGSTKPKLRQLGDWSEHISSSGKRYFYNWKSEVSQWEKPKEWIDYERQHGSVDRRKAEALPKESRVSSRDNFHSNTGQPSTSYYASKEKQRPPQKPQHFNHQTAHGQRDRPPVHPSVRREGSSTSSSGDSRFRKGQDLGSQLEVRANGGKRHLDDVATNSSSPKRAKDELERDLNRSLEEFGNSVSDEDVESPPWVDEVQSNGPVTSVSAGAEVDLDRLPQLLVEIAERHNVDLAHPHAVDQLKKHLRAALAAEENTPQHNDSYDDVNPHTTMDTGQDVKQTHITPPSRRAELDPIASETEADKVVNSNRELMDRQEEEEVETIPSRRRSPSPLPPPVNLSSTLMQYYRPEYTAHVSGWAAEHFERQARQVHDEGFRKCLDCAQISAELKCARSLVRTAEIKANLLEQRLHALNDQYQSLETMKPFSHNS